MRAALRKRGEPWSHTGSSGAAVQSTSLSQSSNGRTFTAMVICGVAAEAR